MNANGDRAHAFRVVWRVDGSDLAHAWKDIVSRRHLCDRVVAQTPSLEMFVSCICGVFNKVGAWKGQLKPVYPAVGYWAVFDGDVADELIDTMNHCLLSACPSAQIKPIISMGRTEASGALTSNCGPIFIVLKDHNSGFVNRKIKLSQTTEVSDNGDPQLRNAKLAVRTSSKYMQDIATSVVALSAVGLCIEMETF